jgi:hypothetical protein
VKRWIVIAMTACAGVVRAECCTPACTVSAVDGDPVPTAYTTYYAPNNAAGPWFGGLGVDRVVG